MSIEVVLFVVVGAISVAAAVMMLLSENAVHSALFLILNFACVAFLFVLLDAGFLALVQVAVYAGAIMVLFLFVIMLLGAEKVSQDDRQFNWLSPVALTLALAFLIAVGLAIIAGDIDDQPVPVGAPYVRVIHAAPDFPTADVYVNGELFVAGLGFMDEARFESVPAGDYAIGLAVAGDDPALALPLGQVTLAEGEAYSLIAHGEGRLPALAQINEDLQSITGREGRLVFFNGLTQPVSLVNVGTDFEITPGERPAVVVERLEPGEASAPQLFPTGRTTWAFVNADNPSVIVMRLRDLNIARRDSDLVLLAAERTGADDGAVLRPAMTLMATPVLPVFGSAEAIGMLLFVDYMLPMQIVALLLLASMVGAIVLTQRAGVKPKPGRPLRRRVSRPLTSVIATQTGHSVTETETTPRLTGPESAEKPEPAGD